MQHLPRPPSSIPASHSRISPLPNSNSQSNYDPEFEPPSFLQLGVHPSFLDSPFSSFCYWCGTEEDESAYFETLELAEENPSRPGTFKRVKGRLACSFCVERTKKWMARGDGEERKMGKLEKLAWISRKLEYSGKKERASLVRKSDGGTAEEE